MMPRSGPCSHSSPAKGNLRLHDYHRLLSQMWPHVEALLPKHKMIAVYADRIEAME
jgi:hypothetical protein